MTIQTPNSFRTGPDETGHFGLFGGRFVAETLMPLILSLEEAYKVAKADPEFHAEMNGYLAHYVGRPSPLYFAERLTDHLGGAKIYLKRDELNHTGAHKVNNVLGQILLARRMGMRRRTHVASLVVELGVILGLGWVAGSSLGIGSFGLIVDKLDMYPALPPPPAFTVPGTPLVVTAVVVAVVVLVATLAVQALAERTKPAEILRLE